MYLQTYRCTCKICRKLADFVERSNWPKQWPTSIVFPVSSAVYLALMYRMTVHIFTLLVFVMHADWNWKGKLYSQQFTATFIIHCWNHSPAQLEVLVSISCLGDFINKILVIVNHVWNKARAYHVQSFQCWRNMLNFRHLV